MTKLYHVSYRDMEGFFDDKGVLLAAWCENDAHWRSEYMDKLLKALGYQRISSKKRELVAKLKELVC